LLEIEDDQFKSLLETPRERSKGEREKELRSVYRGDEIALLWRVNEALWKKIRPQS